MSSFLPLILIALFGLIKTYVEESRKSESKTKGKTKDKGLSTEMKQAINEFQGRKEKTKRGRHREADYKDLPIEVQRAIKSFQKPEKKPAKKEALKVNEDLKKKRQMKDEALKQATETALAADHTMEAAPVKEPEPKAEKPSPFGAIEKFDEAYRPFIYSEVFNKPKCKRK
ncbi:hypothetical protein [Peptoniphilus sp. EMRHCC_23]|uniref:hypothetical protein n=1 Tax=Peptoniphilus rachelemmaiella TaxID=2811779 RepID=UPI001C007F8E|nr:hypothetical protein [Peptoniphilus rachelemmaiella]